MKKQVTIKINETSTAFLRQGGFKGYVKDQGVLHWKEVLEEAAAALNVRREILEMHFNGIMNIAIEGLEEDGRTRQLGEYFELALGVRGAFGSKGAKFDAADHKLRANLIPLRRLRKFSPHFQVSVDNKAPRIVLESLRSVSRPDQDGLVFGEPLLLKGHNLWNIPPEPDRYDYLGVTYCDARGPHTCLTANEWTCSADGTALTLDWPLDTTTAADLPLHPRCIQVELRSRAGIADADPQCHRIEAPIIH